MALILSHWGSAKPKPAWAARIRASTSGKSVMGKSDWFWFISKCGLPIPDGSMFAVCLESVDYCLALGQCSRSGHVR